MSPTLLRKIAEGLAYHTRKANSIGLHQFYTPSSNTNRPAFFDEQPGHFKANAG